MELGTVRNGERHGNEIITVSYNRNILKYYILYAINRDGDNNYFVHMNFSKTPKEKHNSGIQFGYMFEHSYEKRCEFFFFDSRVFGLFGKRTRWMRRMRGTRVSWRKDFIEQSFIWIKYIFLIWNKNLNFFFCYMTLFSVSLSQERWK